MTTLGLNAVRPKADVQIGFRSGMFRYIGVAIGGASGTALVLGAYELLQRQPEKGFALLQSWGPASLIALVAIFVVGQFLGGMNQTVRESFSVVAESVREGAMASGRTADALARLADQGGRQSEEVRRLAIYAGREFPSIYERFDRQDEVLHGLAASVERLHARMEKQDRQGNG